MDKRKRVKAAKTKKQVVGHGIQYCDFIVAFMNACNAVI